MGLTDREADFDIRARYVRLLAALRLTRDHNPETLEAFERILQPEALAPFQSHTVIIPESGKRAANDRQQYAA
jgi:hypothetical protein